MAVEPSGASRARLRAKARAAEVKQWEDCLARYLRSDFRDEVIYRIILDRLDRAHGNTRRVLR